MIRVVEYRSGEPTGNEPTRDPLELTVLHGPKTARLDIDAEYVTRVVVSSLSDIWFEDTEIGSVNRRSLASFLERIEDAFPVAAIERTSEWVPVEDLEAIY